MFSLVRALPPRPRLTRGYIQTSPTRGLYQMPSLCIFHMPLGDPTTGSELSSMLFRNIRPLRPRGTFPAAGASTSPKTLALRPAALLALLSDLTRFASSHRELLLPGFRRFGRPPRRRISLRRQLGNLHRRDPYPLEHRLALRHYPGALPVFAVLRDVPCPTHPSSKLPQPTRSSRRGFRDGRRSEAEALSSERNLSFG